MRRHSTELMLSLAPDADVSFEPRDILSLSLLGTDLLLFFCPADGLLTRRIPFRHRSTYKV